MTAPLTNAYVTRVTKPSEALNASGDPVGQEQVWTGRAAAYLSRIRRNEVPAAGGQNVADQRDVLWLLDSARLPAQLAPAGADWEAARITVEDRRARAPVTRTWTVEMAEHRHAGTIADNLRLELTDEGAA